MACDNNVKAATRILSQHHHGSHRGLLYTAPRDSPEAGVDAIIVPTARNPLALDHAIGLATKLGCTLVTLCSKYSTADRAAARAATAEVELLAIDVSNPLQGLLPAFRTSRLLENTRFHRNTDTSQKRNLGLLIARMAGWQRIVFLDDDIEIPEPFDLRRAAALTERFAGVGLNIHGYPDNSVVCHAYREAGGAQDVFVGGGALVVDTRSTSSFFPNIYNEDWFFLLDSEQLQPTAVTGIAYQKPYDPFARDDRARMEELGDVLAEGLFWLLDEGRPLRDAHAAYWRQYLAKRQSFIIETVDMVRRMEGEPERRHRMLESLKAACGRSQSIKPELCEEYVRVWRADRQTWRAHLERAQPSRRENHRTGRVDKVIANLGLVLHSRHLTR
jgi:glycosyltransferase involved in cell wall biosynthesis